MTCSTKPVLCEVEATFSPCLEWRPGSAPRAARVSAPRSTAPAGRRSAPAPPRRPSGAASSPFASERRLELTAKEAQSMAYCWCRCVLIIPRVITLQNMWTAFKLPALFLLKPGYIYRASAGATRASPLGCIYSQTQLKVMGRDRRSEGRKSQPGRDPGSALGRRWAWQPKELLPPRSARSSPAPRWVRNGPAGNCREIKTFSVAPRALRWDSHCKAWLYPQGLPSVLPDQPGFGK